MLHHMLHLTLHHTLHLTLHLTLPKHPLPRPLIPHPLPQYLSHCSSAAPIPQPLPQYLTHRPNTSLHAHPLPCSQDTPQASRVQGRNALQQRGPNPNPNGVVPFSSTSYLPGIPMASITVLSHLAVIYLSCTAIYCHVLPSTSPCHPLVMYCHLPLPVIHLSCTVMYCHPPVIYHSSVSCTCHVPLPVVSLSSSPLLDHASLHSHNHTLTHYGTLLITCTCCYDLTKGTQDKDFSYSFIYLSSSSTSHPHLPLRSGTRYHQASFSDAVCSSM